MKSDEAEDLWIKIKEIAMMPRKEYLGPFYRQVLNEAEKQRCLLELLFV